MVTAASHTSPVKERPVRANPPNIKIAYWAAKKAARAGRGRAAQTGRERAAQARAAERSEYDDVVVAAAQAAWRNIEEGGIASR